MEDIKEQTAALPREGDELPKLTIGEHAKFRVNAVERQKEREANEGEARKTKESKAREVKSRRPKTNQVKHGNGKKHSAATSSRKDQVEQNAVKAGA